MSYRKDGMFQGVELGPDEYSNGMVERIHTQTEYSDSEQIKVTIMDNL